MLGLSTLGLGAHSHRPGGWEIPPRAKPMGPRVFLNPVIWLSVRQLAPAMLGLGLCLLALDSPFRRIGTLRFSLLSGLPNQRIAFACGLALWLILRRRWVLRIALGTAPVPSVIAWSFGAKALTGGNGLIGGGNWCFPLQGILDASSF